MGKSILLDQRQWLGRTLGASLQLDWTTGLDNWIGQLDWTTGWKSDWTTGLDKSKTWINYKTKINE
jgi:hypothetical protein